MPTDEHGRPDRGSCDCGWRRFYFPDPAHPESIRYAVSGNRPYGLWACAACDLIPKGGWPHKEAGWSRRQHEGQ